jgi:2-iminobutanoate/2-iminopropanoate deaminase
MAELETVTAQGAPAAIGPYGQAVAHGPWVFCSGQIPLVPGTKEMKNGSIQEATEQVLANLKAVLSAAGCSLSNVIKTTVYLADLDEFAGMNEVYAATFGEHRPARACVQVARLPAGARVEIDAVAVRLA